MRQTEDQLALSTPWSRLLPTIWTALAIALLGVLLIARPALAAAPTSPQPQTSTFEGEWEEEIEDEEGEEGDEEWEETEDEDDGGWEQIFDEEEPEESPKSPPQPLTQCPLSSVKPQAFFARGSGDLRLVLRYSADSPTSVDVDFWLKGGLQLGSTRRQLNETGALHLDRHLGQGAQSKIDGPPVVIVQVKAPEAPSKCKSKVTKRLTAQSGGGHPASDLGASRRA